MTKKWAYYNDTDPYCAEWVRNLIATGLIPDGEVDERPIEQVQPEEVAQFAQCHWFCGIAGWAYAARLAGWRDTDPIWTGSCPCQPYSPAGKRLADRDPRNLWPDFARLIAECRPARVAGEQVASKAGRLWLAGVRADLEALGYGVGAADLCVAGVSAPHIRQRLWWVADADEQGESGRRVRGSDEGARPLEGATRERSAGYSAVRGMGDSERPGLERHTGDGAAGNEPGRDAADAAGSTAETGRDCGLPHAESQRRQQGCANSRGGKSGNRAGEIASPWSDSRWIACADGKARRLEPGIEPLVTRLPGHVEQVRAYGNSIVPQEAAEVLMAWQEAR